MTRKRWDAREETAKQAAELRAFREPGLQLTPEAVERIKRKGRSRIRKPANPREAQEWMDAARRARPGIPGDVLLPLNALRQLADEGNRVAAILFESECKRLGIWVERRLWTPQGRV